jgi:uncharacterized protein YceK
MFVKNSVVLGLATVVAIGICSSLSAQEKSAENSAAATTTTVALSTDQKNRETLKQRVTLDFEEIPFVDVMDMIRAEYVLNILLDQSAKDDSLTEDELVTFKVKDIELGTALQLMLHEFNATYLVRDEVVRIISKDVAYDPEYFAQRIINCEDLIRQLQLSNPVKTNTITTVQTVSAAAASQRQRRGGNGGGVFNLVRGDQIKGLVDAQGQVDKEEQAKTWFLVQSGQFNAESALLDLIKTSVAPDDWDDTNGDGTVMIVGGCLVIRQTEGAINQTERLLRDLQATMASKK